VEGSADFIGAMISGGQINEPAREYGLRHEGEWCAHFRQEMHGTDTSHWMYEGKVVNGRPADLAYFMRYRLAEAYYNKASNQKKAIAEILNFKDADKLPNDSGYADRFEKPGAMQDAAANPVRVDTGLTAGSLLRQLWAPRPDCGPAMSAEKYCCLRWRSQSRYDLRAIGGAISLADLMRSDSGQGFVRARHRSRRSRPVPGR